MKIITGNMWDHFDPTSKSLFCITTNSYIKKDGTLVMGAGVALEAATRWPQLPSKLAELMLAQTTHLGTYGLLVGPQKKLAAFQTKIHFKDPSTLELIQYSIHCLNDWLEANPEYLVNLPCPGVGNGGLSGVEVINFIVEELHHRDRVTIWFK